jgi:hypothetical protein
MWCKWAEKNQKSQDDSKSFITCSSCEYSFMIDAIDPVNATSTTLLTNDQNLLVCTNCNKKMFFCCGQISSEPHPL